MTTSLPGRQKEAIMSKNKVSIIGAGNVGATATYYIAEKVIADLVMVDVAGGMTQAKAVDFLHAGPLRGYDVSISIVGTDDFAQIADSNVVVITAGLPRKPGMDRMDLLKVNAGIVKQAARAIVEHAPNAIVIVVSNPLDIMCHVALRSTGFALRHVVGMAGILDSTRFRYFVAEQLGCALSSVHAMVLGGHGDQMVPLPRLTTVGGVPITQLMDAPTIARLVDRTRKGGAEIVALLKTGSAYYAPAASVADMVEAVITDRKHLAPCAAYLRGEYGIDDLFIGVPTILGKNGVERIIELELLDDERAQLHASAVAVRKGVDELNTFFKPT
ncbi:MAG TPA: malate dehydrogenase [Opitutaceae bacterium]|jgi:malate dehydrogenase|nr:malate dehydrogenase [Opitutaceae bacterium]